MFLRKYQSSDCEEIAKLFYDTVHRINARDYSKEELDAWATGKVSLSTWDQSFRNTHTLVVIENEQIIGFANMGKTGYLDMLYVHKDHQNEGVATLLCNALESSSKANHFSVHASITAKPFFEHRGYCVTKKQQVLRHGIYLTNFVMEK